MFMYNLDIKSYETGNEYYELFKLIRMVCKQP